MTLGSRGFEALNSSTYIIPSVSHSEWGNFIPLVWQFIAGEAWLEGGGMERRYQRVRSSGRMRVDIREGGTI